MIEKPIISGHNVRKYYGVPGSGKTSRLIDELDRYSEMSMSGSSLNVGDIAFTTFSKTQAHDANVRICNKFGIDQEDLRHSFFGTIHHLCLMLLDWDLVNKNPKKEDSSDRHFFLAKYGILYPIKNDVAKKAEETPETDALPSESESDEMTDGEKIFLIFETTEHRCMDIENWKCLGIDYSEAEDGQVISLYYEWKSYKQKNNLVSYNDMLLEVLEQKMYPNVSSLFVDEFQDLTPLLYKIICLWTEKIPHVTIAGDDDQTIYTFSGASSSFFMDFPGEEIFLSVSHRVPENILEEADALISQVENRKSKDIIAEHIGGGFHNWVSRSPEMLISLFENRKTYLLFRTNWHAKRFTDHLIAAGVPYTKLRMKSSIPCPWISREKTEFSTAVKRDVFLKLKNNYPLLNSDVRCLVNFLPVFGKDGTGYIVRGVKKNIDSYLLKDDNKQWEIPDLKKIFYSLPRWENTGVLVKNDVNKSTALLRNLRSRFCSFDPRNIQIGTLHSAKGLEAEDVFIFNNHTRRIENSLIEDESGNEWENECRLYYVGITRAKQRCFFINNFFRGEPSFKTYCWDQ